MKPRSYFIFKFFGKWFAVTLDSRGGAGGRRNGVINSQFFIELLWRGQVQHPICICGLSGAFDQWLLETGSARRCGSDVNRQLIFLLRQLLVIQEGKMGLSAS